MIIALYFLFEPQLLSMLTTWSDNSLPEIFLRATCLIVSFLVLILPFLMVMILSKYLPLKKHSQTDMLKYQRFKEAQ